jgi:ABC-type multidrug transport system permease subunit
LHQIRQFGVLTHRNFDILTQHFPSLIPLLMQPLVICTLILVLFNSGAFEIGVANPATALQITFFLAFGAFFFGVNYGTDELAKEAPIFLRERMVNLAIAPYVLGKVAVLGPLLALVQVFMLIVLRLTQRLPALSVETYAALLLTLILTSLAALALGFVASAAVGSLEQAGALTPMLIMPQLLFSGAILAVPSMNVVGRAISAISIARWSFEGNGHILDLNGFFASTTSPVGRALLLQYGDTFSRDRVQNWLILLGFIVVCLVVTGLLLKRKGNGR